MGAVLNHPLIAPEGDRIVFDGSSSTTASGAPWGSLSSLELTVSSSDPDVNFEQPVRRINTALWDWTVPVGLRSVLWILHATQTDGHVSTFQSELRIVAVGRYRVVGGVLIPLRRFAGSDLLTEIPDTNVLAVVSSSATAHDGNGPELAFDSNLDTWWSSTERQSIQGVLSNPGTLRSVNVNWVSTAQPIRIQVPDGTGWRTVYRATSSIGEQTYAVPAQTVGSVRVSCDGPGNNAIREIQLRSDGVSAPPVAPVGMSAIKDTAGVALEWRFQDGPAATTLTVQRASPSSPSAWQNIATLNGEAVTYLDPGGVEGDFYRWIATNSDGETNSPIVEAVAGTVDVPGSEDIFQVANAEAPEWFGTDSPEKAIDQDPVTRFAVEIHGRYLQLNAATPGRFNQIDLTLYNGDVRVYSFTIQARNTETGGWETIHVAKSSGSSAVAEPFLVPAWISDGIRIVNYGNSANNFLSISEVAVDGSTDQSGGPGEPITVNPTFSARDGGATVTLNASMGVDTVRVRTRRTGTSDPWNIAFEGQIKATVELVDLINGVEYDVAVEPRNATQTGAEAVVTVVPAVAATGSLLTIDASAGLPAGASATQIGDARDLIPYASTSVPGANIFAVNGKHEQWSPSNSWNHDHVVIMEPEGWIVGGSRGGIWSVPDPTGRFPRCWEMRIPAGELSGGSPIHAWLPPNIMPQFLDAGEWWNYFALRFGPGFRTGEGSAPKGKIGGSALYTASGSPSDWTGPNRSILEPSYDKPPAHGAGGDGVEREHGISSRLMWSSHSRPFQLHTYAYYYPFNGPGMGNDYGHERTILEGPSIGTWYDIAIRNVFSSQNSNNGRIEYYVNQTLRTTLNNVYIHPNGQDAAVGFYHETYFGGGNEAVHSRDESIFYGPLHLSATRPW